MSYTVRNFKWDCSTERVAERSKSVVVQGDIAVVAEVVGEPGNEICMVETRQGELKTESQKIHLAEAPRRPDPIVSTLLSSSSLRGAKLKQRSSKNI